MMKLLNFLTKTLLLLSLFSFNYVQAEDKVYTAYFNNKAVSGYDAVAYFTQQKAHKGSSNFTFKYQGADWYFSSQENRDKFKANPEYFAPQYGGHCSWAMSQNKIAAGDPKIWTIYKNRLYLYYAQGGLDKWQKNPEQRLKQADANWANMEKE